MLDNQSVCSLLGKIISSTLGLLLLTIVPCAEMRPVVFVYVGRFAFVLAQLMFGESCL